MAKKTTEIKIGGRTWKWKIFKGIECYQDETGYLVDESGNSIRDYLRNVTCAKLPPEEEIACNDSETVGYTLLHEWLLDEGNESFMEYLREGLPVVFVNNVYEHLFPLRPTLKIRQAELFGKIESIRVAYEVEPDWELRLPAYADFRNRIADYFQIVRTFEEWEALPSHAEKIGFYGYAHKRLQGFVELKRKNTEAQPIADTPHLSNAGKIPPKNSIAEKIEAERVAAFSKKPDAQDDEKGNHKRGFWDKAKSDYTAWLKTRNRDNGAKDLTEQFFNQWEKDGEYASITYRDFYNSIRHSHKKCWEQAHLK